MDIDSQQTLDSIFLSYNKILNRLQALGIITKHGKEISHMDLRKAIDVMIENIQVVDGEVKKLEVENILFQLKDITVDSSIFSKKEKL